METKKKNCEHKYSSHTVGTDYESYKCITCGKDFLKQDWKVEFKNKFGQFYVDPDEGILDCERVDPNSKGIIASEDIKDFITKLLTKQEEKIRKEESDKVNSKYYSAILKYAETFTADQGDIKVWIERDKLLEIIKNL